MKNSNRSESKKKGSQLPINKGIKIAATAAALLSIGFVPTPIQAKKPTMVNCIMRSTSGCGSSCPSPTSQVMTLEECRKEGGTPTALDD